MCYCCRQCRSRAKPKEIIPNGQKRCSKCHEIKILDEFYSNKSIKDGFSNECKTCHKQSVKQYRTKTSLEGKCPNCGQNKEDKNMYRCEKCQRKKQEYYNDIENRQHMNQQKKEYYKDNKKEIILHQKEYVQNNKEKIIQQRKISYQKHKKQRLLWNKKYLKEYYLRPGIKEKRNNKHFERWNNDIQYRMAKNLRSRLYHAIKDGNKSGSAVRDLGCSIEELKIWLENKFQSGMTWENWGTGDGKWHIDHIMPLSSFDLTDREQFLKACHYTNLQPLWAEDNLRKGNKMEKNNA